MSRTSSTDATTARRVGRNDPCPCGSGRKHKKCCLGASVAATTEAPSTLAETSPPRPALTVPLPPPTATPPGDARAALFTSTGERVQPVRAYFDIVDGAVLSRALRGLRCVDDDPAKRRRVWLWAHEAREFTFKVPYEDLSPRVHPLVIASLLEREGSWVIEVRSWERLIAALRFFDVRVPSSAVRLRCVHVVNRIFTLGDHATLPSVLDSYFEGEARLGPNLDGLLESEVKKLELTSMLRPLRALMSFVNGVERAAKAPLPPLEEIRCEPAADDNFETLSLNLGLRGLVAAEHLRGNTNATLYDMFLRVSKNL